MAIIVMDTATEVLAVGIGRAVQEQGTATKSEYGVDVHYTSTAVVPRAHSRWLQPAIAHGMKVCQLPMDGVETIGVGIGPGSYTGVRLGVSTGKAMAFALGAGLAPIPTLLAMAQATCGESTHDVRVLPLLNARRNRAFGAIYERRAGRWSVVTPIQVQDVASWFDVWHQTGYASGAAEIDCHVVHDFLTAELLQDLERTGQRTPYVRRLQEVSASLPAAMLQLVAAGEVDIVAGEDIHAVVPEYALLVEAESRLAERSGPNVDSH